MFLWLLLAFETSYRLEEKVYNPFHELFSVHFETLKNVKRVTYCYHMVISTSDLQHWKQKSKTWASLSQAALKYKEKEGIGKSRGSRIGGSKKYAH